METAKKSRKKTGKASSATIRSAYHEALLNNGKKPVSVYRFCADSGFSEIDFYDHFASFDAIERDIWKGYVSNVVTRLNGDEAFVSFSAREKILSFYFTLIETLKDDRSFVLMNMGSVRTPGNMPAYMKGFRKEFDLWVRQVIEEGKASGEISKRPWVDTQYGHVFWMHMMFILQFWVHDDSPSFENTDAAIEKSVNLAFGLIGKGVLDNALDFGKFLYQTAKN